MSEDKDNNTQPETSPPAISDTRDETEATTASSGPDRFERDYPTATGGGGARILAVLALLLVLAVGAAAAWVVWEAQRRESALLDRLALVEAVAEREVMDATEQEARLNRLNSALENNLRGELRQGMSTFAPAMEKQSARLGQLAEALETLRERVSVNADELARYSASDRESWLLAEVEYLLRLANQRLIMTGDVVSAQALLDSADTILRQLDDARLHPVRRAVAADLAMLRAVPRIDTEGLYLRLSALSEAAVELSIFELPEAEQRLEPAPAENWQQRLRQGFRAALDKVSEYVIVRRRDVPMASLMDPQWEGLVRQNLRMMLEQAQVALLSGNARLYQESLQRARYWVGQFFESDARAAQAMDEELEQLGQEVISVALPDITRSLDALARLADERENRGPATGPAGGH